MREASHRIAYDLVPLSDISVVARQTGAGFSPYQTQAGGWLLMVDAGNVPAAQMFADAVTGNTILTWILRLVGLLLLGFAFALLLAPLGVAISALIVRFVRAKAPAAAQA